MSRPPPRRLLAALGLAAVVLTFVVGCGSSAEGDPSGTSVPTDACCRRMTFPKAARSIS